MRDDRIRLGDVLEATERIEKYTSTGRDALSNDELVQTWVVHHLMIGYGSRKDAGLQAQDPANKTGVAFFAATP